MTKKLTKEKVLDILLSMEDYTYERVADEFERLGYIEPKEEKKVIEIDEEVWINVHECGRVCIHVSRDVADSWTNGNRIACEKFHLKRSVEI